MDRVWFQSTRQNHRSTSCSSSSQIPVEGTTGPTVSIGIVRVDQEELAELSGEEIHLFYGSGSEGLQNLEPERSIEFGSLVPVQLCAVDSGESESLLDLVG